MSAPPDIKLPRALSADVDAEILLRTRDAVEACADRNDDLRDYDDLLRGRGVAATKIRWPNASRVEDPLARLHHIALLASLMGTLRQPPFWLVESSDPDEEENAQQIEAWLTVKAFEQKLLSYLYDVAYLALRDPTGGVLYCGWREQYKTQFTTVYVDDESGQVVEDAAQEPGKSYTARVKMVEEPIMQGIEFRAVEGVDFFLDPPNATDPYKADAMIERKYLSANDLQDGVTLYGYDAEAVADMLRRGPTGYVLDDIRRDRDDTEGIHPSGRKENGYWECYQIVGRLPLLWDDDGASRIPEQFRYHDFVWEICLEQSIVLKRERLPYDVRPYVVFNSFPTPNRAIGESAISLLKPLAEEATYDMRTFHDMLDLMVQPVHLVPIDQLNLWNRYQAFPGGALPYTPGAGEIKPLERDFRGLPFMLERMQDNRTQARELISAEGFGQLPSKVRKSQEVQFAQAGVDQKFDLILSCFQRGMEQLAVVMISLHAQHMDADGETVRQGLTTAQVNPQMLRKRFRYVPHANSANSNPQLRMQKWATIKDAIYQSPLFAKWVQSDHNYKPAWNLLRHIIEAADERNVVALIGQEPPDGPDPLSVLNAAMQALAPLAQKLPPVAQALQQIQGAMQATEIAPGSAQSAQQPSPSSTGSGGAAMPGGGSIPGIAPNPHDVLQTAIGPQGFQAAPPPMNGNGVG